MKPTRKSLEMKLLEEPGTVQAVFATLNVRDKDGDVTLPGALPNGKSVVISAYGHSSWSGEMPVGKGTISEVGNELVFNGQFFLNTTPGRDTYETVKAVGAMQEWSYGLRVLEGSDGEQDGQRVRFIKSMDVFEVSPVLVGAGVNTRTLDVKSSLVDHTEGVLDALSEYVERVKSLADLRAKEGRTLSAANRTRLETLAGSMRSALEELDTLLTATTPAPASDDGKAAHALFLEYQRTLLRLPRATTGA